MPYVPRAMERKFLEYSGCFRVVLLTGPRGAGKKTMLRHLAWDSDRSYVSLDDDLERELARKDPALFFQKHQPPILIDEIQYAPQLLPRVKLLADASEERGVLAYRLPALSGHAVGSGISRGTRRNSGNVGPVGE